MKILLIIILLFITGVLSNLIGIVSFNNVDDKILYIVKFDDINKLIMIDKIYSYVKDKDDEIEQKIYNFKTAKYLLGSVTNFTYSCKWYDSILLDYLSLKDIITPTKYNQSFSRELAILFTGSWIGEILIRKDNIIGCDLWKFQILSSNNEINNLINYNNSCNYDNLFVFV